MHLVIHSLFHLFICLFIFKNVYNAKGMKLIFLGKGINAQKMNKTRGEVDRRKYILYSPVQLLKVS